MPQFCLYYVRYHNYCCLYSNQLIPVGVNEYIVISPSFKNIEKFELGDIIFWSLLFLYMVTGMVTHTLSGKSQKNEWKTTNLKVITATISIYTVFKCVNVLKVDGVCIRLRYIQLHAICDCPEAVATQLPLLKKYYKVRNLNVISCGKSS